MQQHDSKTCINAVLQSRPGLQVLSHLGVQDLRCLASTCHTVKEAVTLAILPKAEDVTEAQENTPIACRFTLADVVALLESFEGPAPRLAQCHLLDFTYTKHNRHPRLTLTLEGAGCACDTKPSDATCLHCTCAQECSKHILDGASNVDLECGPACSCSLQCPLRVTQRGVSVALVLHKSPKGMAVMAAQHIVQGQFVAQYAGEVLTNKQADIRLAQYDNQDASVGHALMIVREMLPSGRACLRLNIDATHIGNIARFFNHSCDGGNLALEIRRSRGSPVPHVAMFASKDIRLGDEITFSYGDSYGDSSAKRDVTSPQAHRKADCKAAVNLKGQRRRCLCKSKECCGFLPCC